VRSQIEQQRFPNFTLEAGILFVDGVICANLQVNRSLLLAVLAEIKTLLANYAAANGKHEEFLTQGDVDWDDHREPETELIYLLCSPPADKEQGAMEDCAKKDHLKKVRKFGKRHHRNGTEPSDDHSGTRTSGLGSGGQRIL
jgi:hypothetical protein